MPGWFYFIDEFSRQRLAFGVLFPSIRFVQDEQLSLAFVSFEIFNFDGWLLSDLVCFIRDFQFWLMAFD